MLLMTNNLEEVNLMSAEVGNEKRLTVEEFLSIYGETEDGYVYELDHGVVLKKIGPAIRHQDIAGEVESTMRQYFKGKRCEPLREVFIQYKLSEDNVKLYKPDVLVICSKYDQDMGYLDKAPDLIVEVWSKSNDIEEIKRKTKVYRAMGVKEFIQVFMDLEFVIIKELQLSDKEIKFYPFSSLVESTLFEGLKFDLSSFVTGEV